MGNECNSDPFGSQGSSLIVAKITECCADTNVNIQGVKTSVDLVNANLAACCTQINNNLGTVITLLTAILAK